jgi:hypothetical protein
MGIAPLYPSYSPLPALDGARFAPHCSGISRPDGRSGNGRKVAGEESPGSMDTRCRIASGGGDPRDSATENKPPRRAASCSVNRGKGEMVR